MSVEDEIKAIATDVAHLEGHGRLGQTAAEADVHRQLQGIWDALLIIARAVDQR
jgi:hypothetical protein